ncbi:LysR family transcriptional regulator [Neisseriaceae bacterium JH1-16]|nr:LysR family transcriptional regulator [Neisseriaceae bacterium JH1-16]
MRDFDLAQLRTFVAIAEAGSVSAAAKQVFLSQSSVSEQLKKLEERAGQPLLLRGKKGSTPTPAGEKLLNYAQRILALSAAAYEDLQGQALDGELRLAITDYYRPSEIARVLKRFAEEHPRLRLHVTILQSAVIERSAGNGDFDIGLAMRLVDTDGRHIAGVDPQQQGTVIRREPLVWVAAQQSDMPERTPLPLVVLPASCALQQFIATLLARHRVPYLVSHTASGVAGLQLALSAGLGVSCLNSSAVGTELAECPAELGLPPLPLAEFRLLPPTPGEAQLVSDAREALSRLFR